MKASCLRPIAALIVVSVLVAVAAGCGGLRPRSKAPDVTNIVYLETLNGQTYVRVSDEQTHRSNNVVKANQRIVWHNTNDWDFCVMFSRNDNPFGGNAWKPLHKSQGPVSITAPPVPPNANQKVFKYSIIAFESVPTSPAPTMPGAVTNTVVVRADDPFIIIQN